MSSSLYFLVYSGSIITSGQISLPESYKNISNVYNLEKTNPYLLSDLKWSGNSDQGFWIAVNGDVPSTGLNQKISSSLRLNTSDQTILVDYFAVDMTPDEIAARKKQENQIAFDITIAAGYNIPNTSIYLKMGSEDRIAWNQLLSLLNELLSVDQITLDTKIKIVDVKGEMHEVSVKEAKQILAGLGFYYYQLWTQLNSI
jgi:hypothetical protein